MLSGGRVRPQKRLIQQHVFGLPASCLEHEVGPAATQSLGCLVDEVTLPDLGANAKSD
jgi:hypothetical protein